MQKCNEFSGFPKGCGFNLGRRGICGGQLSLIFCNYYLIIKQEEGKKRDCNLQIKIYFHIQALYLFLMLPEFNYYK